MWNYTPHVAPDSFKGPQTDPQGPPEQPVSHTQDGKPIFATPVYDRLFTNITKEMMSFSDLKFPEEEELFPTRQVVYDFLVSHAKDLRRYIKFSTQVQDVRLLQYEGRDNWMVKTKNLLTGYISQAQYDAVVVANGHHQVPYIPEITGLSEWARANPGSISHVKDYKTPGPFAGKKLLIIGAGPSGVDVAEQLASVTSEILLSVRSEAFRPTHKATEVSPVREFISKDHSVQFEDGRLEMDIDAVLFCTGYLYSFPFLKSLDPPVVTDGMRVLGLYKQLFRSANPTLAFSALPVKATPFQISEFQAAAFARVWSGRLELPTTEKMDEEEAMSVEEHPQLKFHDLGYLQPGYMKELWDWCNTAKHKSVGKLPQLWDERVLWIAKNFQGLRIAYSAHPGATSPENLGFEFQTPN